MNGKPKITNMKYPKDVSEMSDGELEEAIDEKKRQVQDTKHVMEKAERKLERLEMERDRLIHEYESR